MATREPVNNDELWKVFGKDTPAGKALYEAYLNRQKSRPVFHQSMQNSKKSTEPKPAWGGGGPKKDQAPKSRAAVSYPKVGKKKLTEAQEEQMAAYRKFGHGRGRKPLKAMLDEDAYEPELPPPSAPKVGKSGRIVQNVEDEKKFLQEKFARTKTDHTPISSISSAQQGDAGPNAPKPSLKATSNRNKAPVPMATKSDSGNPMFDQIVQEIQERKEFLDEMRAAGRGAEFEKQIQAEISSRVAELRKIHAQLETQVQ
eukprot:TRINITY_DN15007_c0_g1_i1.p1 TRINITY_DN15007_c0_g1~~TRINITY_DN15007_c0_g1_i1.p1  ORF type:complete len:257 (-),score=53.26 TRINITY_DN15007_c0_g1_i1:149-919(-)